MKKRLSLIVALTLVLISLFTLGLSNKQVNAATLSDQEKVEQEINNIVMPEKAIIIEATTILILTEMVVEPNIINPLVISITPHKKLNATS
jgi:hypothetical protein